MSPSDNKNLIGAESSINEIESLLKKDVCIVGIWGNGGIGKTTIVRAVYNKLFRQFERHAFVENVREESEHPGGLIHLRNKLLETIFGRELLSTEYSILKPRFGLMRILIVLDDVTSSQQIEALIEDPKSLGLGSRIIITTRDKQVLHNCGVDSIYEVKKLSHPEDLQLFSLYAFKLNTIPKYYMELSIKIVNYASGFPLALKVLGSSLLYKGKEVWESKIKKLEKGPPSDVQKVLKVSYDGLDEEEKNIFLDIVCFFKWNDTGLVIKFLEACGFSAYDGISVLTDKCLINASSDVITMHDLIEEMGKKIVQEESKNDPSKFSRLWRYKDIHDVLTRNLGTNANQGIRMDISKIKEIDLHPEAFTRMNHLRFFDFCCSCGIPGSDFQLEYDSPRHCTCEGESYSNVHVVDQRIEFDFSNLRYLRWHQYPARALLWRIQANHLVALIMPHSKLVQFWNGTQHLSNLKHLNLSHSKDLTQILDISRAPNLESLNLEGCTSLIEISSLQNLFKLVILNMRDCESLSSLPGIIHSKSLQSVILSGCSNLKKAPMFELPSKVAELDLQNCSGLENLPRKLCMLKSLKYFNVNGCLKLESLPEDLGKLKHLEKLNLQYLSFQRCESLKLPSLSGLISLRSLDLTGCHILKLPDSLGQLCSLEKLCLCKCSFESIPISIKDLSNLKFLDLSGCKRLRCLPELPRSCVVIQACCCVSLHKVSDLSYLFSSINSLYAHDGRQFNLANCFKLDRNALCDKVKDGILRIQQSGDELFTKRSYKKHRRFHGCIFFTGHEIPAWFNFQTRGSSMSVKLPPDWNNKNFLGFAIGAIVQFPDHIAFRYLYVSFTCKTKSRDGVQIEDHFASFHAHFRIHINEPLAIQQDHVLLGFALRAYEHMWMPLDDEYVDLSDSNMAYFKFAAHDMNDNIVNLEVKNCGMHLLFAQDCGEPMEEGEEHEPQPKRLK